MSIPKIDSLDSFLQEDKHLFTQGSIGGFLSASDKTENVHYLITAAHVVFPFLSNLKEENINQFNDKFRFAKYDEYSDFLFLPMEKSLGHTNMVSFGLKEIKEAQEKLASYAAQDYPCLKFGAMSGTTVGTLTSYNAEYQASKTMTYRNLIEVTWGNEKFAIPGDSGSFYFVLDDSKLMPIAIHRISDPSSLKSYGTALYEGIKKIIKKMDLNENNIQICQHKQCYIERGCVNQN